MSETPRPDAGPVDGEMPAGDETPPPFGIPGMSADGDASMPADLGHGELAEPPHLSPERPGDVRGHDDVRQ